MIAKKLNLYTLFHSQTMVRTEKGSLNFLAGDVFVPVNQAANDFFVQVLEPEVVDSYFKWRDR